MFSPYSKLDVDHLYMSYADIMAKVRHMDGRWSSSFSYLNEMIYIPPLNYELTFAIHEKEIKAQPVFKPVLENTCGPYVQYQFDFSTNSHEDVHGVRFLDLIHVWSLTRCHLPPELPHWWGGRRGRTGGGGAILWGATDRDGMGGPGGGRQGSQRRSNSPRTEWPHHIITLGTPPDPSHLCYNISHFFPLPGVSLIHSHHLCISCYGGLTCACLCWTRTTSRLDSICFMS